LAFSWWYKLSRAMRWIVLGIILLTVTVVVVAELVGSAGKERRRPPRVPREQAPAMVVPARP
jgi:hypothetical protein